VAGALLAAGETMPREGDEVEVAGGRAVVERVEGNSVVSVLWRGKAGGGGG